MQSLTRAARYSVLCDMNDTVGRMRWCGWLLVAACNRDPSFQISVHHPTGYTVARTEVTVYFGGDVVCNDIEFGDRTDAELAEIAVDQVELPGTSQVEVSRLGGKSIVARGFDAQQRFVTAGCKDVGEIAGDTRVAIDTLPTASVAIDPGQPDRPLGERTILVNMTDPNGKVLDGAVSWQLTGPAGAPVQMASAGIPTKNGNIRFSVADLGTPGPEGLRIRAPWATAPLPLVTGFDLSHQTMLSLGSGSASGDHPSCDVRGHAGKPPTLVCLTPSSGLPGHRDVVEISWQGDQYVPKQTTIPGNNQFALLVDHDGSADEPVYVMSADATGIGSWYKLGDASMRPETFAGALQNVVYVSRCAENSTPTALVGVQTGAVLGINNQVQFFRPDGTAVNAAGPGEVLSGGCIHDVDKREHQAVVASGPGANGEAVLELINPNPPPGAPIATPISSAKLTGSGFITVEAQGATEKRFAGTRLQASGTVVFEAVLAPQGNAYMLVERTEVEAAAPPEKIIAGKLDRDGDTDLMWDMGVGARRRAFQVSLAEQVGGAPLTAITSGPGGFAATTSNPTDFTVADLNGKGTDEMVLFTSSTLAIYSPDE